MLILGFDTTAIACSVALVEDDRIISEIQLNRGSKHSEQLLPVIDNVFKLAKKDLSQVDLIAVSAGPGSFTGVRIAAATGKSLAQAQNKKIIQINSLDALAQNIMVEDALIIPLLDARKNEFYTGWYRYSDDKVQKIKDYYAVSPKTLFEEVKAEKKVYFLGEGIQKYKQEIKEYLASKAVILPSLYASISGSAVAFLAMEKYKNEEFADYYTLAPVYLRKPEAELTWEAKNSGR